MIKGNSLSCLQFGKSCLTTWNIFEWCYIAQLVADKMIAAIAEHCNHGGVDIGDLSVRGVEQHDAILGCFEEPPIANFRCVQLCVLRRELLLLSSQCQVCRNASEKFLDLKRLCDVIDPTGSKGRNFIVDVGQCGHEDDRNVTC